MRKSKNYSVSFFKLAVLYGSKFIGAIAGFVFMPIYLRLMGAEDFSIVAVITSLQAFALIFDFGVLTTVGRDLAVVGSKLKDRLRLLLSAEGALIFLYFVGGAVLIAGLALLHWSNSKVFMNFGVLILLLGVILQALHGTALISLSRYYEGALCNTFMVVLRSIGTWIVIRYLSPSIEAFVFAQALFSVVGALVSRIYSMRHLQADALTTFCRENFSISNCVQVVKKSRALIVSSLVGAAATQLDKTILLGHVGAEELSAYFLAHSISSMPLAIVATPIVQYFQPKVIALHDQVSNPAKSSVFRQFGVCIVLSMAAMALFFSTFGHALIDLWLTDKNIARLVMDYVDLLVIAYLVAGVGYIPYVMMIAGRGYAFNAKLAVVAAVGLLGAVFVAAIQSSVEMACFAFIGYYGVVTAGLFFRMFRN